MLARLIDGWRATARVYGLPELRAKLEVERTGLLVPIRPEAGERWLGTNRSCGRP